jgi:hypothetical protein
MGGAVSIGMNRILGIVVFVVCSSAFAEEVSTQNDDSWSSRARFFVGARGGVAVPPGGDGMAQTVGMELGVAAEQGVGFGLHLIGMRNPPAVEALNIPKTSYALGAAADIRFYFQTVEPLTLYPTLSFGFVGGAGQRDGKNVVLPLINPGFGARMKFDKVYIAFEFGAASFYIPFVNFCIGWEPERKKPTKVAAVIEAAPEAPVVVKRVKPVVKVEEVEKAAPVEQPTNDSGFETYPEK